jgi:hypothetical protein
MIKPIPLFQAYLAIGINGYQRVLLQGGGSCNPSVQLSNKEQESVPLSLRPAVHLLAGMRRMRCEQGDG